MSTLDGKKDCLDGGPHRRFSPVVVVNKVNADASMVTILVSCGDCGREGVAAVGLGDVMWRETVNNGNK